MKCSNTKCISCLRPLGIGSKCVCGGSKAQWNTKSKKYYSQAKCKKK